VKIFGDDGFRDKANKGLLSKKFLNNFFSSLNNVLKFKKIKTVTIGYDTRSNKDYILKIILKKIISVKKIIILDRPVSTPGLQFSSKKNFGIMITASHFPSQYNGFKFFLLGKKIEKDFEYLIIKNLNKKNLPKNKLNKLSKSNFKNYIDHINYKFSFKLRHKIIVDCSNGSVASFYKKINFLKNLKVINTKYKSNEINKNCGTNFLTQNIKKKKFKDFQFCLAFDGDADRFLVSEKNYGVIETEKIALIFTKYLQKIKKKQSIVATEIVNPWLIQILKKDKIKVALSKVGDRNVIKVKNKYNSLFGFETSGHFSFKDSMDGLYGAGLFLKILKKKPHLIYEVLKDEIDYKKKIFGLDLFYLKSFKKFLKKINKDQVKIIIRKSIWNNYYKIYIFYKSKNTELGKLFLFLNNKIIKKKFEN
tara:strand:- start:3034 stop:4296 length:1263 start_codon:yes stop_codon:yes gene_type:complete